MEEIVCSSAAKKLGLIHLQIKGALRFVIPEDHNCKDGNTMCMHQKQSLLQEADFATVYSEGNCQVDIFV